MKKSQSYSMCVISGLLLGLSVPSFPFLPLGFLAWAWLVPLLPELKKTDNFFAFIGRAALAVGIGFTIITLWVVNASVIGLLASMLMGIIVWTLPFAGFYLVKRFLNWNIALWSLPFVWTAWEWFYHQTEISFGAVRLAYTQADLLWLIQYADITGVEGVTFWLVLLNVALFVFYERNFGGENAAFDRQKILKFAVLPLILLILPLFYASYIFLKPETPAEEITILAVQPNVSPYTDFSPDQLPEIFGKQLALTDKAVKKSAPDLILWHEGAIPYVLTDNPGADVYLAKQITKWKTPVLTGIIEVKNYADGEQRPLLIEAQKRDREFFNAAAMFQPANIQQEKIPVNLSEMYLKRRLMPFLEHVPYSDHFPSLADLIIPIGARPRLSAGKDARILEFQLKNGETVRAGTMICYENLYPEMSADLVRSGAQILTSITNEGFFADSNGQYQLAEFSRFRSIETRRALVRAAATGITRATDKFGRVTAEVPMWSEQTLSVRLALSDEQTFYVRFGDFFPKFCAAVVFLLTISLLWRILNRIFNFSGK